jgi:hypothetical protein
MNRILEKVQWIVIGILALILIISILSSLEWPIVHDPAPMLYAGFLMDQYDMVPYRDFFEQNMVGTYWIYLIIGKVTGYTDIGFRILDLLLLLFISVNSWLIIRSFSRQAAWLSALLFPVVYLGYGLEMSMQREYLLLLPLTFAMVLLFNRRISFPVKSAIIALLFGLAATVKPHFIIGAIPIYIYLVLDKKEGGNPDWKVWFSVFAWGLLFMSIPSIVVMIYLYLNSALNPFLEMVSNYLPLYSSLDHTHHSINGLERFFYLLKNLTQVYDFIPLIIVAVFNMLFFIYQPDSENRRKVFLIISMATSYLFYTALSGQFWNYHYLVFYYLLTLAVCTIVFCSQDSNGRAQKSLFFIRTMALVLILLHAWLPQQVIHQLKHGEVISIKRKRVDEITAYLDLHARPGDLAQALGWVDGAAHALLNARLQTATPFFEDFFFYHHVSHPYIRGLRKKFINSFQENKPKFVIEITSEYRQTVSGPGTTDTFPELQNLLNMHYTIDLEKVNNFRIYRRIPEGGQ